MRIAMTLLMAGLLTSLGCSNTGTQVTSAASLTNSDLQQMVQSKLTSDPQLAQVEVSADADQNQVTLSGSVASEQARSDAVDMAKAAHANLQVVDKIDVKPPEVSRSDYTADMARETREKAKALGDKIGQSLDDAWIYTKIETKLAGNSTTPALKINVDVARNVVTLRGDVDSAAAKQEAEQIAKDTDGVKAVRNLINVKA
ncbi:MAG: BON domain-containing protein [Acidobacteriia bacterium]|nr:BON domain-containing protein [Terriglobia bacterium]